MLRAEYGVIRVKCLIVNAITKLKCRNTCSFGLRGGKTTVSASHRGHMYCKVRLTTGKPRSHVGWNVPQPAVAE